MTGLETLRELSFVRDQERSPSFPPHLMARTKYNDRTANGLTRCIVDYINFTGGQAERISNTGRQIDKRETFKDALGITRTIGSVQFVYGTGTNGTADISSVINGKSVKIEIKIKADRMSEAQIKYKESIEKAGGLYFICRDFQSFYDYYLSITAK